MKRFALTLNVKAAYENMDTLNHSYIKWCELMQIQPVLIPNLLTDHARYLDDLNVQGLILTGGNDISGLRPLQQDSSEAPPRDRAEQELMKAALERDLPVLGICRGMQFINVYFGGTLLHDISDNLRPCQGHVGRTHTIRITSDTIAAHLGVRSYAVNSFHNHAITADRLAPPLEPFAVSQEDNIIEGLIHPTKYILGIQWHPERSGSTANHDIRLATGFLHGAFWRERKETP